MNNDKKNDAIDPIRKIDATDKVYEICPVCGKYLKEECLYCPDCGIKFKRVPLKVLEVLLHKANTGDFVVFKDSGWQIGCTYIDHEDLFMRSLSVPLINSQVKDYKYVDSDLTNRPTMEINII